jgi:cytochrome c5
MRFGFFIFSLGLSLSSWAVDLSEKQQIEERIKPIGQVRLVEQATKTNALASSPTQEPPGQAIYEKYCSVCHRDGLAGAPKFRIASDWKPRLDKQKFEGLLASATQGVNAMPMKGTCMECTEEDLKNAIQYMLPQP